MSKEIKKRNGLSLCLTKLDNKTANKKKKEEAKIYMYNYQLEKK
jgi:hypothetical protein